MLAPEFYGKLRWNLFRMHYQFIMANDMRAPYEYFMLVCGPVAGRAMGAARRDVLAAFAEDATYAERAWARRRLRDSLSNSRARDHYRISDCLRAKARTIRSTSPRGNSRGSNAATLLSEPGTTTRWPRIRPS